MGSLRLLLALSVVFAHVGDFHGFRLGDGRLAVQTFYMISGFYMAMVWSEKYSKLRNPIRTFYESRALRIYPMYFVVLAATILMALLIPSFPWANPLALSANWGTMLWVYLTQITLIKMETPLFYDFNLHNYMVLSVAWTLGLELTFYLLVPLLLPRISVLVGMLVLSLTLRVMVFLNGPTVDASLNFNLWSFRFFPFEIALFLAGALAYRLFAQTPIKLLAKRETFLVTILGMLGGLSFFGVIYPRLGEATYWIYYAMAFVGIAVLFQHTKISKRDSYVGELSYPIYIVHIPILSIILIYVKPEHPLYVVIPATLVVSMILSKIQNFVDDYRHALVMQQSRQVQ